MLRRSRQQSGRIAVRIDSVGYQGAVDRYSRNPILGHRGETAIGGTDADNGVTRVTGVAVVICATERANKTAGVRIDVQIIDVGDGVGRRH